MENEGVKERLQKYIEYKGVPFSRFEKDCGLSNGYISSIRTSIQPDRLSSIARNYPDLNLGWLMVGEELGGPMVSSDKQHNPSEGLPLISFEAIAGPGAPVYDDISADGYYAVSEFSKSSDFLVRVKGDSMSPKYTGGDIVACKKVTETLFFQWGRVYVLYTRSQGVMIKRIQPSENEDCVKCVSDNTKYAPFDVPKSDIVSLALVNGSISLE